MLPPENRLCKRRDFAAVYARKKSWADNLIVLQLRLYSPDSELSETRRFGFSVSKKVGKAVVRNRVKRRLREICRVRLQRFLPGFDLIFVARSESAKATFAELSQSVERLSQRARLWRSIENGRENEDRAIP